MILFIKSKLARNYNNEINSIKKYLIEYLNKKIIMANHQKLEKK
jgi:hypothetical protein